MEKTQQDAVYKGSRESIKWYHQHQNSLFPEMISIHIHVHIHSVSPDKGMWIWTQREILYSIKGKSLWSLTHSNWYSTQLCERLNSQCIMCHVDGNVRHITFLAIVYNVCEGFKNEKIKDRTYLLGKYYHSMHLGKGYQLGKHPGCPKSAARVIRKKPKTNLRKVFTDPLQ